MCKTSPKPLASSKSIRQAIEFEVLVRQAVLQYFVNKNFLEVQTKPASQYSSTEKYLYPFTTTQESLSGEFLQKLFLRFSPEMEIKKLLSLGFEKIVELGWVFRNREEVGSVQHSSQFCMLEWYESSVELTEFICSLQHMLLYIAKKMTGKTTLVFADTEIDLKKNKWHTLTVSEAFLRYAKVNFTLLNHWDDLIPLAVEAGATAIDSFDDAFGWFLVHLIEPSLKKLGAVILLQYPKPAASFAALRETTSGSGKLQYADRFECYIGGMELANGFRELTNGALQRSRMEENIAWLERQHIDHAGVDEGFISAVNKMQPCCGVAMGFERLVMLLSGKQSIEQTFLHRFL